jgi:cytochrome c-type biogenesis protein CcmE
MAGLRKKRRIQLVIFGFVFLGLSTVLIGYAFKDGIQYFRSPTQVIADQPTPREIFKLGGLVKDGTFVKDGETARFVITDTNVDVAVSYTGILPDLFKEGQGTIVTGQLANNVFTATEVLAKHDENYLPKEVADALKEQGVFKADGE